MVRLVLVFLFFLVVSFGVNSGDKSREDVAENINALMASYNELIDASEELKKIEYENPVLYKEEIEILRERFGRLDVIGVFGAAVSLIDEDASGRVGFEALRAISTLSPYILAGGGESEEGKLSNAEYSKVLRSVLDKALEFHMDSEDLGSIITAPLQLIRGENYVSYKRYLEKIIKSSPHEIARARSAYALADEAFRRSDASWKSVLTKEEYEEISRDAIKYSEFAVNRYGDIVIYGDKTVKSLLDDAWNSRKSIIVGKPFPDIKAKNLTGEADSLSQYLGNVVLIDFWATWCGPCTAGIPGVAELKKELSGKPFEVIAVSIDDSVEAVLEYQEEQPMPWVNWHIGPDSDILTKLNISGVPAYFLIDTNGVLVNKKHINDEVKNQIRQLVQKASDATGS